MLSNSLSFGGIPPAKLDRGKDKKRGKNKGAKRPLLPERYNSPQKNFKGPRFRLQSVILQGVRPGRRFGSEFG